MARWLDAARTVQIVPPLCAVLWHVSASPADARVPTPWFDLVVPDDIREDAATEWAADVRSLLTLSGIAHRAETIMLNWLRGSSIRETDAPPTVIAVWGCMSLYHQYRCGAGAPLETASVAA